MGPSTTSPDLPPHLPASMCPILHWPSSSLALRSPLVLLELLVEGLAGDAQDRRRPGLVPLGLGEDAEDVLPLHLGEGLQPEGEGASAGLPDVRRQVGGGDLLPVSEDDRLLEDVPELPDVPRPVVLPPGLPDRP